MDVGFMQSNLFTFCQHKSRIHVAVTLPNLLTLGQYKSNTAATKHNIQRSNGHAKICTFLISTQNEKSVTEIELTMRNS